MLSFVMIAAGIRGSSEMGKWDNCQDSSTKANLAPHNCHTPLQLDVHLNSFELQAFQTTHAINDAHHVITASFEAEPATDLEAITSRQILALDANNKTISVVQHRVRFNEPSNSTFNVTVVVPLSDVSNVTSLRGMGQTDPWLCLFLKQSCPDGSTCSDYATCCENDYGGWGCCGAPNAICCGDRQHCCASGQICTGTGCISADLAWIPRQRLTSSTQPTTSKSKPPAMKKSDDDARV